MVSSKSGVVKLCDFGFARTLGEYNYSITFHTSYRTHTWLYVVLLYILTSIGTFYNWRNYKVSQNKMFMMKVNEHSIHVVFLSIETMWFWNVVKCCLDCLIRLLNCSQNQWKMHLYVKLYFKNLPVSPDIQTLSVMIISEFENALPHFIPNSCSCLSIYR